MNGNLLVIDKRVLPDVFDRVIFAKKLLKEGKVKEVTEAVKQAGISRSVYYKYKDFVFEFSESINGRKLTFNMSIVHETGVLSLILNYISEQGGNLLTIDQNIPIDGIANVSVTVDITSMKYDVMEFLNSIGNIQGVEKIQFIALQ